MVRRALDELFGVPEEKATPDASFQDLGLDSSQILELAYELEEKLEVVISNEILFSVRTVGNLCDRLEELRADTNKTEAT